MNRMTRTAISVFILLIPVLGYPQPYAFAGLLRIEEAIVRDHDILVKGVTAIPPETSTYIQYYVGKKYPGTLTNCIHSSGFHADKNGAFELMIPAENLKGPGTYRIVLEQNPSSNQIIPPERWVAFQKKGGEIVFGDIGSLGEIENLALAVGMETAAVTVIVGKEEISIPIHVEQTYVTPEKIIITGRSDIAPDTSSFIQYYVGKLYDGTQSVCILCDGFHTDGKGNFTLNIPIADLKGSGRYEIVLEQNPSSNTILPPRHWIAFRKTEGGVVFGDITSMGEIANLALTVGMAIARTEVIVAEGMQ